MSLRVPIKKPEEEKHDKFDHVDVQVLNEGTKVVLPEGMSKQEGIKWLERRIKEDETEVGIYEIVETYPLDGAAALMQVLKNMYGWASAVPTPGFFGPQPPTMVTLPIGHNKTTQVIWGAFVIPNVEGRLETGAARQDGRLIFCIQGSVKQKYKSDVERIANEVRKYVREKSIYRGKAIRLRTMDNGDLDENVPPTFMDTSRTDPTELVHTEIADRQIRTHLYTPIEKTNDCRKYGIPLKRSVLLEGPYGCISGETIVPINRAKKGFKITLETLVHRFNGDDDYISGRHWEEDIDTFVQSEIDGVAKLNRLKNAWCSGMKTTYTVTTESGLSIRATSEHPFLTDEGWKKLNELKVGDSIHVKGEQKGDGRQARKQYQLLILKHHPYRRKNNAVDIHRLVAEARYNAIQYDDYIQKLHNGDLNGLNFIDPSRYAVHHIDGNIENNIPENLEVMTHHEHFKYHAETGGMNNILIKICNDIISSIELYGEEMTYDLEVEEAPHNFIVNDFVVHNTGKTFTAYVCAKKAEDNGWTFIYLDRVAALKNALVFAKQYTPAVVFAEDIDRVMTGNRSIKVDDILNTIDGVDSKHDETIVILTTNAVENIEKAMIRPGRLDAVIHIGPPDAKAAERLMRVYGKELISPTEDLTEAGKALDGQIPATIAEVVKRAKLDAVAFNTGGDDLKLTGENLEYQAKGMMKHIELLNNDTRMKVSVEETLGQAFNDLLTDKLTKVVEKKFVSQVLNKAK